MRDCTKDDLWEDGLMAIGHVDEEAKQHVGEITDIIGEAIAHACAVAAGGYVMPTTTKIKFLVALMKNLYKSGYVAGEKAVRTQMATPTG